MKKSTLKSLIKFAINEIEMHDDPSDVDAVLMKSNPIFNDKESAQIELHKLVQKMLIEIKEMIKASVENNIDDLKEHGNILTEVSGNFLNICTIWARQISNVKSFKELARYMNETNQVSKLIFQNLAHKNYINAKKEIDILNNIFKGLHKSVDDLFQTSTEM